MSKVRAPLTFAFTDIEGSTERWERDRKAMQDAVRRHDSIVRGAIESHDGTVFKTMGDAFCAAFARPDDAVSAMLQAQRGLATEGFAAVEGLRVRAAINTGAAEERDSDYFGPAVNKVARLLAIGHGGQILLTDETAALVELAGITLRDLGAYHLKDFAEPQRVRQVVAPDLPSEFPPLRSVGTLPSDISIVDSQHFHPVASFSARHDELAAVDAALARDGAIALVYGLGGVGKSSIAREYGWQNRDSYSVVWWLDAQSENGIVDGLLRLGSMFIQGLDRLSDRRAAAYRVINSLLGGFDKPVLLVFDNLEDEALMHAWLPRTARALATSRDATAGGEVVAIALDIWSVQTAAAYLQRATARADLQESDARAIAQALGALPLAMAHAAAALRTLRTVSPQRYLERITEHLKRAPRGAEYPQSVFATFTTAIAQAEQQAAGSQALLCFAAFFSPDAIPEELFRQPQEAYNISAMHDLAGDGLRLDEALGALDRLSLLSFNSSSRTYGMHRLVQIAAKDLAGRARDDWCKCAVVVAREAFPEASFATWSQCARLLSHATAALEAFDAPEQTTFEPAVDLASRCAHYLFQRGEYRSAEALQRRALSGYETLHGGNHLIVVRMLNRLGNLCVEQARYAEAETLYRRALEIAEAAGSDEDVARTLNNLAICCREQGLLEEHEALQKRSLAIKEQLFGADHPQFALGLDNLANGYREQGRYDEAEALHLRALAIRERALDAGDPHIAMSLCNLACVHVDQGRYDDAERHFMRAHDLFQSSAGPEHPQIADLLQSLAKMRELQGRTSEAQALYARELAIREKIFDPNDRRTAAVRARLELLGTP